MNGPPRFGVGFSRGLAPADIVEAVKLAESLGYESAWMAEGHAGDQFAVLGAAAAVTTRIRLGTSISKIGRASCRERVEVSGVAGSCRERHGSTRSARRGRAVSE